MTNVMKIQRTNYVYTMYIMVRIMSIWEQKQQNTSRLLSTYLLLCHVYACDKSFRTDKTAKYIAISTRPAAQIDNFTTFNGFWKD